MSINLGLGQARQQVHGAGGVVAAVISQAYQDFVNGDQTMREDAALYFANGTYRHHLTLLGLDPDLLPELITRKQLNEVYQAAIEKRLQKGTKGAGE